MLRFGLGSGLGLGLGIGIGLGIGMGIGLGLGIWIGIWIWIGLGIGLGSRLSPPEELRPGACCSVGQVACGQLGVVHVPWVVSGGQLFSQAGQRS